MSEMTSLLNLSPIIEGVDSFELRVWYGLVIVAPQDVLILRYKNSSWQLTRTNYWVNYTENGQRIVDSFNTTKLKTSLPFDNIADSLKSFGLDTFTTQYKIPGFRDHTADGVEYTIEFSTANLYNVIRYHNPRSFKDPYDRKMVNIINYLEKIGVYHFY
jgi:hypothetical protein